MARATSAGSVIEPRMSSTCAGSAKSRLRVFSPRARSKATSVLPTNPAPPVTSVTPLMSAPFISTLGRQAGRHRSPSRRPDRHRFPRQPWRRSPWFRRRSATGIRSPFASIETLVGNSRRRHFFDRLLRDFHLRRPKIRSNHLALWAGARAGDAKQGLIHGS